LTKASKPPRHGSKIFFPAGLTGTVMDGGEGIHTVAFYCSDGFDEALEKAGEVPLPPYIRRNGNSPAACNDREAYQTVYAQKKGAVAAPTAGLHFSPALLTCLERRGVRIVPLTLHVGHGTFLPVRVSDIRQHKMHSEWYELTASTASAVNDAKAEGRRVVAVGTTVVRVLEHRVDNDGRVQAGMGSCDLFIYPGFRFRAIDAMITNFHLPGSTLLMLVCAFAGREFVLKAYREAVDAQYRFFSYGDATFVC
jgi:S-adenosylmethionine:tRNA ribosyltransferase-isomerase